MVLPFLQLSSRFFNLISSDNTYALFFYFFFEVPPFGRKGLGPNFLIVSSNSIATSLNFEPSAELQNSILIRSGSNPIALRTSCKYSERRYAK